MFNGSNWVLWLLAILALVVAGGFGLLWWRGRVRRLAERARKALAPARKSTRHPIVLAHGWFGFDALPVPGVRQEYFRGVRSALEADGNRVLVPRVSPIASIRKRAQQLNDQLQAIDAERVNIVAHSMGGLDARYAITHLGLAGRVASLTTFGTPHRGTPLANKSLILGPDSWARRMLGRLGADMDGLRDLTLESMHAFNRTVPDMDGITYSSYVGWVDPERGCVNRLLQPGYRFLNDCAGRNDGLVPASSQPWGEVLGEAQADHWAQIGWSPGLDTGAFYTAIVHTLARRGF